MNRSEKILLYLDGKMTEEELVEFREQLKIDPDLMEELDFHRLTNEVSRNSDDVGFSEKLADTYDEYEEKGRQTLVRKLFARYSILKIVFVAIFVAAFLLILFFQNPFKLSESGIYSIYYEPFNNDFLSRSMTEEGYNYPKEAMQFYIEGNYLAAYQKLMAFSSDESNQSVVSSFYLGLSAMENNEFMLAIESFEGILREDFSFLHEHAQWYLSLCYIKMEKYPLSNQNLMDLKLQRSIYSKNAKKILQKIPK